MIRLAAALCLFLPVSVAAQTPAISAKEAALGDQMAAEILKRSVLVNDAELQIYVERIARRLGAFAKSPFPCTLHLVTSLDRPASEPLSLPGGHIVLPSGLILNAAGEDELAALLAHAMAHSQRLSPSISDARGTGARIPLIFVGSMDDSLALPKELSARARELEIESDAAALRTLRDAGYDPEALYRYLARTQVPATRLVALRNALGELARPAPSLQ